MKPKYRIIEKTDGAYTRYDVEREDDRFDWVSVSFGIMDRDYCDVIIKEDKLRFMPGKIVWEGE